jgi:hypothetical protein
MLPSMAALLNVSIDTDLARGLQRLRAVSQDRWPAILTRAANETAYYVLNKYRQQMPKFLDRPTAFTLNSMYVAKATASKLEATVQWKDSAQGGSAGRYLQPEVYGGERRHKGFENALQALGLMPKGWFAIPSANGLPLDAYGNVPRGVIQKILAALKANPETQNKKQVQRLKRMGVAGLAKGIIKTSLNYSKVKGRETRAAARKAKYFTVLGDSRLAPGIYERVGTGIRQVFFFLPATHYKKQFPFYELGQEAARKKFPEKLDEAISKALA